MVGHMVASCVREMPGVIASGSTVEGTPLVFIAMNTGKGYALAVVHVAEFAAPEFDSLEPPYGKPTLAGNTMLETAMKRHGPLCPECGIAWDHPSPKCPHRLFNLHPAPITPEWAAPNDSG